MTYVMVRYTARCNAPRIIISAAFKEIRGLEILTLPTEKFQYFEIQLSFLKIINLGNFTNLKVISPIPCRADDGNEDDEDDK